MAPAPAGRVKLTATRWKYPSHRRPFTDRAAVGRLLAEPAIVAAVDLTNQLRHLQEDSGPREGCARPEPSRWPPLVLPRWTRCPTGYRLWYPVGHRVRRRPGRAGLADRAAGEEVHQVQPQHILIVGVDELAAGAD